MSAAYCGSTLARMWSRIRRAGAIAWQTVLVAVLGGYVAYGLVTGTLLLRRGATLDVRQHPWGYLALLSFGMLCLGLAVAHWVAAVRGPRQRTGVDVRP